MPSVRPLTPADTDAYIALRAEALLDSPWAFGSSPGHDRGSDAAHMRASLANTAEFAVLGSFEGAFTTPKLVAVAGLRRDDKPKHRHLVSVWGVYCTPAARGKGHGRAVMAAAIAHARTWPGVASMRLSVSDNSPAARALYESLGFIAWGTEPDNIRWEGRSYSEIHMHRPL